MRLIVFLLALLAASPALAQDWHRAESEHYIVHGELDEAEIREVAKDMEAFRQALVQMLPSEAQRGRKLEVYLDKNTKRIEWAFNREVSGYSMAGAEFSGSFSRYDRRDLPQFRAKSIHFAQASDYITSGYFRTLPPWFRVGASAALETGLRADPKRYNVENAYMMGVPDVERPLTNSLDEEDMRAILTVETFPRSARDYGPIYARSRELARVLLFDAAHSGKLEAYLDALTKGASLEGAIEKLGDLAALEESVAALNANRNPPVRLLKITDVPDETISVRPMGEDEIALVAYRFARLSGERANLAAKRLRGVADDFPDSAEAWFEYAAAEYALVRESLFGGTPDFRGFGFSNSQIIVTNDPYSDRIAWQAVNRALEIDPAHAEARVLKAEIQIARLLLAEEDENLAPEFEKVRALIEPLAARPEVYPLAAAVSYQSFLEQEIEPPQEALERLGRAFIANRGVAEFRYAYASALARVGERETAELLLKAMLSNPKFRDAAQAALDQVRPR